LTAQHGIADPMHWELISKMQWAGLGTPRKHPKFRHMDGSVFNARLYIDDRLVVDHHGMLNRALLASSGGARSCIGVRRPVPGSRPGVARSARLRHGVVIKCGADRQISAPPRNF